MIKFIIADDEEKVKLAIDKLIDYKLLNIEKVGEFSNGDDLLTGISQLHPQIVLTDMKMPGIHGSQLIAKIREIDPNISIIVISGYNDFHYLKQAVISSVINYIMKPIDKVELNSSLMEAVEKIKLSDTQNLLMEEHNKNVLLKELIEGKIDRKNFAELMSFKDCDLFFVGFVNSWNHDVSKQSVELSTKSFLQTIQFTNLLTLWDAEEKGRFVCIFKKSREEALENLREIQREMSFCYGTKTFVSLSKQAQPFHLLGQSYDDAKNEMESHKIFENKNTITLNLPYGRISKLKFQLNLENFLVVLDELLEEIKNKEYDLTICEIKNFQHVVTDAIKFIFNKLSMEKEMMAFVRLEKELSNFIDLQIILRRILMFAKSIKTPTEKTLNTKDDVAKNVMQFINENLTKKITLEDLSNQFYLNKEYISRLFKKTYGIGIFSYIDEKKIDLSNKMLKEKKSIAEIVTLLDYYDESHFYKKYKKIMGFNPTHFFG